MTREFNVVFESAKYSKKQRRRESKNVKEGAE